MCCRRVFFQKESLANYRRDSQERHTRRKIASTHWNQTSTIGGGKMSEYSKKAIFDELRTGSHISIGHPMWTYIVENQEELSDYFQT